VREGPIRKTHFVGIGGTGMCGLAEILLSLGYEVSGSDLATGTDATERLARLGAKIYTGHAAENARGADLLVVSSAVGEGNPEVREARRLGLPVLKRGEMLAEIMRLKYGVAIAGAHGKTTTTSLIGHVLSSAGLDPTVIVGGRLRAAGSNAMLGVGDVLVAEADESDGSFLKLLPTVAVVTNIDREHLDHYRDLDEICEAFLRFIQGVPFYGVAVLCGDDEHLRALLPGVNKPVLTYGTSAGCRVLAADVRPGADGSRFTVRADGRELGEFLVPLPGGHNVLNALATIAVARFLGVPTEAIRRGLASFEGVGRRFERRGEAGGALHIDDYGHHPTEIAAVLRTGREVFGHRRLIVLFQPHRYSRTAALRREFGTAFRDADALVVTDIYSAGEAPIPGITGQTLCETIAASGTRVHYAPTEAEAIACVAEMLQPGDVLFTLGAGSVWKWGDAVIEARRVGCASRPVGRS
jgi:UDP-N-acetylmuramate--alanine ligase